MTKKELLQRLADMHDDKCIVFADDQGWSNIEQVIEKESTIELQIELYPVFSDN